MSGRDDRQLLRQAMAEASVLPPDDPVRRQLEQDVARGPEWARQEWLELIRGDEALRIALRQVEVPPGLVPRLLLLADQCAPPEAGAEPQVQRLDSRPPGRMRSLGLFAGRRLALASSIALVVLMVWFGISSLRSDKEATLQTLALLATQDHMNTPHLQVKGSDPRQVAEFLSSSMGFPVSFPALGPGHTLMGGRSCRLGSHPVAYTYWQGPGGPESLFQLRLEDFGVGSLTSRRVVHPASPAASRSPCEVVIWREPHGGYVLVRARTGALPEPGKSGRKG
ncbi:MAG: hypothetical protein HYY25_12090 [Candidatus Wallbacteria bacterium]|nr:hypothetical protein [Candidatus Wallbacteria bacterium]